MIRGTNICLRPVMQDDIALLDAWANDPEVVGAYNSFGMKPHESHIQRFSENGLFSDQYGKLIIVTPNSTPVGLMSYHQVAYGPNSGSRAFSIGINLLAEHRGQGYGVEAQQLLTRYLLATYPVMRIEALTDITNIPEQRALEKAGFTREGVLRQAQWRNGSWHDLVSYSCLRTDTTSA